MTPETGPYKRPLPVAEPTYPPPGARRPRRDAAFVATVTGGGVLVVLVVVAVVGMVLRARTPTHRSSGSSFGEQVDQYCARIAEADTGTAQVDRLADVALLAASQPATTAMRPVGGEEAVQILAVQQRRVDGADGPQHLLFVAYEPGIVPLPVSRASESALAYLRSGFYPADAVVLLHWTGSGDAGRGRAYAVDFVPDADQGVAIVALDSAAALEPGTVAFALGDPVSGEGSLISRWTQLPAAG